MMDFEEQRNKGVSSADGVSTVNQEYGICVEDWKVKVR